MGSAASIVAPKVRQAQLARDLGVKRQSIHELLKRGVLVADAEGLIDVALAKLALADRLHPGAKTALASTATQPPAPVAPAAPAPATSPDETGEHVTSYHVAKTLREIAEARLAELKLAEQKGDLVRIADVRAELARHLGSMRSNLLQLPARLAPLLATEDDQGRIHTMLDAELRAILTNVALAD